MKLAVRPTTLRAANTFVGELHRHHGESRGCKFAVSLVDDSGKLRGVAICGRPVARGADNGSTLEVTRLCTDGSKNACSMLYGACARIGREMGYSKIITYILESESGASLRASGWTQEASVNGRSWSCESRPRTDKHPTVNKTRWGRKL